MDRFKKYDYVRKLLHKMKCQNFVNVYYSPFTKKNYYFLTTKSESLIGPNQKSLLSEETYYHDAMVSSICVELSKIRPAVEIVELEHIIKNGKMKNSFDDIVPDARIRGNFNGKSFLIAIEVEINQKEKSRIIFKGNNYLKNSLYDYVFYFFPDERLMKNYAKAFLSELGTEFNQKIFLFSTPEIFEGKNNISDCKGLVNGKSKSVFELFGIET